MELVAFSVKAFIAVVALLIGGQGKDFPPVQKRKASRIVRAAFKYYKKDPPSSVEHNG